MGGRERRFIRASPGGFAFPAHLCCAFRPCQSVIDAIQYGEEDAAAVERGKGPIPVADYKLTATVQCGDASVRSLEDEQQRRGWDVYGERWGAQPGRCSPLPLPSRAVYSFCMCPGGQVVPTSTNPDYLCINGMSFSRRNSRSFPSRSYPLRLNRIVSPIVGSGAPCVPDELARPSPSFPHLPP